MRDHSPIEKSHMSSDVPFSPETAIDQWIQSHPQYTGMTRAEFSMTVSGSYGKYVRQILDCSDYTEASKVNVDMPFEAALNNRVQLRIKMVNRGLVQVGPRSIITYVSHPLLGIMAEEYLENWFNPDSGLDDSTEGDLADIMIHDYLASSLLDSEYEFNVSEVDVVTLSLIPPKCETIQ